MSTQTTIRYKFTSSYYQPYMGIDTKSELKYIISCHAFQFVRRSSAINIQTQEDLCSFYCNFTWMSLDNGMNTLPQMRHVDMWSSHSQNDCSQYHIMCASQGAKLPVMGIRHPLLAYPSQCGTPLLGHRRHWSFIICDTENTQSLQALSWMIWPYNGW